MSIEEVFEALGLEAHRDTPDPKMRARIAASEEVEKVIWAVVARSMYEQAAIDIETANSTVSIALAMCMARFTVQCAKEEKPFPSVNVIKAYAIGDTLSKRLREATAAVLAQASEENYTLVIARPSDKKEHDGKKAKEA